MYRYSNGQISLADFKQPVGMNLKESNRWVKKAQTIPWPEIEKRYAALFTNRKGNVAKPLRLALGACIIQAEYGYSDEEIVLQIQENPYLQYFCGYAGYDDSKLPFDASSMVHFRKRCCIDTYTFPPSARFLPAICCFPCTFYSSDWRKCLVLQCFLGWSVDIRYVFWRLRWEKSRSYRN